MIRLLPLLLSFFFLQTARASDLSIEENQISSGYAGSKKYAQPLLTDYKSNVYHATYLPVDDSTHFARLKRKAKWAKWLGIGALASLVVPGFGIFALPAAIVSLVFAGQVKRQTADPDLLQDAKRGKVSALLTLAFFVAAIAIVSLIVIALGNR